MLQKCIILLNLCTNAYMHVCIKQQLKKGHKLNTILYYLQVDIFLATMFFFSFSFEP